MIEAYKSNRPLREAYLRMNGITHAEIWDTEEGYKVHLCSGDGIGFPESPEFYMIGQCNEWAAKYCPELEIK